jgi:hypothetical protein
VSLGIRFDRQFLDLLHYISDVPDKVQVLHSRNKLILETYRSSLCGTCGQDKARGDVAVKILQCVCGYKDYQLLACYLFGM